MYRRIPQPRAVEVGGEAEFARRGANGNDRILRPDDAAMAVVRVLHLHERRCRQGQHGLVARLGVAADILRGEAPGCPDFSELHPGVRRRPAGFVPDGMRLAAYKDVVARTGEHAQRHLVGHRA